MKVLITDHVHPIMLEKFQDAGYTCDYFPEYTNEDVYNSIADYKGIIINSKIKMFQEVLGKAKKLKFIGRLGSGMEIIDIGYAHSKGIQSFNVPEANCDAVAEHAIGMILSLFNHLNRADTEVKDFIWNREKNRGIELGGKTIGIIGYGHTGKAFAKKLSGFDVKILAYDKYLKNFTDKYAQESTMEEVFEEVDILSFHLPLTNETKYLCNTSYIKKFKKSIFIINTSRGNVIDLKNIFFQIKSNKIMGMCLDVFENEKPKTYTIDEKKMYNELFALESVILSPHVAGWTVESKYKIAKYLVNKVLNSIK